MKLFGSLERLVKIVFRKGTRDVTIEPASQTVGNGVVNIPDMAGTTQDVVLASQVQTLTNKTLTSPTITTPTGIVKADVGLANVDNTSDASKWSATATLTNKSFDADGTGNSITNIRSADIASDAGILYTQLSIADGSFSVAKTSGLQTTVDNVSGLVSLSGVAANSANLGIFSGTIIADNLTVKNAIQSLETYVDALPDPFFYAGSYNATTDLPALDNADTNKNGYIYYVTVAGTQNFGAGNIEFAVGDKVVNNGSTWDKWDMTSVTSASEITNTPAGGIAATTVQAALNELDSEKFNTADFSSSFNSAFGGKSTTNLAEGTNLYFTEARARTAAVADAITDGVIAIAPSQNAVFDALALKADKSVAINTAADSGLSGGGDLSASRSLVIDPSNAPTEAVLAGGDFVLIRDVSASALKKVTAQQIANLASGTSAASFVWDYTTDATVFAISHSFATKNVLVEIYDQNDETVWVNTVDRTSASIVTLTRSEDPGINWTVVIRN